MKVFHRVLPGLRAPRVSLRKHGLKVRGWLVCGVKTIFLPLLELTLIA
jgi:hypothetical protein